MKGAQAGQEGTGFSLIQNHLFRLPSNEADCLSLFLDDS